MTGKQSYFSKGFTLVELLVTLGVLAILAGGVIIAVNPLTQNQKANDAKRKSDLEQIQRGLEQYYNDNGKYPITTASPWLISGIAWGSAWGSYMTALPKDPLSTHNYVYKSDAVGQTYYLYANLQRGANDPQSCTGGGNCTNAPANACGGASACNYGATSSNATP